MAPATDSVQHIKQEPEIAQVKQEPNGHTIANTAVVPEQPIAMAAMPWEPSIINATPYEDLTRLMCDQIFARIGMEEPPEGGAKFEIEAKLGEIQTREEHRRLRMPVLTECLIDKDNLSLTQTRFESSMTVVSNMQCPRWTSD